MLSFLLGKLSLLLLRQKDAELVKLGEHVGAFSINFIEGPSQIIAICLHFLERQLDVEALRLQVLRNARLTLPFLTSYLKLAFCRSFFVLHRLEHSAHLI